MSLQYLSGVSGELGRSKKRAARKETRVAKRAAKKETRVSKRATRRGNVDAESAAENSPVQKSRVKKAIVQNRIRRVFKKKQEPIAVEEQELNETAETQEPEVQETEQQENEEQESNGDNESMGLIYPNVIGKVKKRINLKKFTAVKKAQLIGRKNIAILEKRLATSKISPLMRNKLESKLAKYKAKFLNGELGKPRKKLFKGKVKAKIKEKIKKAKERRKNDKHSPKEKALHKLAKAAFTLPRGAFLAIILLGKALEKTPIKINLAKKLKDSWAKKGPQIKEAWYKFGGEPDILVSQINKATRSQLTGMGGVVAATTASVATATPIVVKLLKILGKAKEFAEKNPKLVAAGQAIAKNGIEKVASKGKNAENYNKIISLADEVTKVLPEGMQSKINEIRKNLPDKLVKGVEAQSETEIQETKDEAQKGETTKTASGSSNKNLMIGLGAAALIGTYLIVKKKK
jgi:hypothetical protein